MWLSSLTSLVQQLTRSDPGSARLLFEAACIAVLLAEEMSFFFAAVQLLWRKGQFISHPLAHPWIVT